MKRQSCGDGRGREREREIWRRGEESRGDEREGERLDDRTHSCGYAFRAMFLRCVLHHVRRTTHANDRFLSMTSERFFSHKPSSQGYVALLQRAPLDRRPDGFLINVCKFLARSKIFLPHSCNNFHTCSIFVPRPKQIYIQQIFANIQSKLVRFEMRDIKKKRRKKRSIGF